MHYNYTNDIPCNHSLPSSAQYYQRKCPVVMTTIILQDCCRIDRGEKGPASTDCRSVTEGKRRPSSTSYNCSLTDDCDRIDGRETNPSSTAKKCSATEDCCRNPGGDRGPSSTVKYCSATGLLPNRQRGERPVLNS